MGLIAKPLGWILSQLYLVINNYGLTLIVFTIIFKFCLYPLYKKQIVSSTKMAEVQPKMMEIQRKYADDKEKQNEKMMQLYKEEGFNPMGGCLPLLIQMPIIMALFMLLRNPLAYTTSDSMIFAIHEAFLWIHDLSQPDLWVLPIAAGITSFISFHQTQQQQTSLDPKAQANSSAGMMKMMKYVYPIIIVWMGRSFPAGLTLYWFISTATQIGFNVHLNKLRRLMRAEVELKKEKKAKAKMEEN